MKKLAAAGGLLFLFFFTGGLWVGLTQVIPPGLPRSVFIVAVGVAFAGTFVWLLVSRVREILGGTRHLLRHAGVTVLEVTLLLLAFAAVYQKIGIIDNTHPDSPVVHSFGSSLYYSVVTFTTLGYGDFYPVGPGRALAGIEALTGYIILGLLASTASSILSPDSKAGLREEDGSGKEDG